MHIALRLLISPRTSGDARFEGFRHHGYSASNSLRAIPTAFDWFAGAEIFFIYSASNVMLDSNQAI